VITPEINRDIYDGGPYIIKYNVYGYFLRKHLIDILIKT